MVFSVSTKSFIVTSICIVILRKVSISYFPNCPKFIYPYIRVVYKRSLFRSLNKSSFKDKIGKIGWRESTTVKQKATIFISAQYVLQRCKLNDFCANKIFAVLNSSYISLFVIKLLWEPERYSEHCKHCHCYFFWKWSVYDNHLCVWKYVYLQNCSSRIQLGLS